MDWNGLARAPRVGEYCLEAQEPSVCSEQAAVITVYDLLPTL